MRVGDYISGRGGLYRRVYRVRSESAGSSDNSTSATDLDPSLINPSLSNHY